MKIVEIINEDTVNEINWRKAAATGATALAAMGALGKADVGIAVSEDVFRFTPSSDAIIEASKLAQLDRLLSISNFSKTVLKVCLAFSVSYNIVGLSFAISGNLTPLIAAILMPISSITVVLISTFLVYLKK